MLAASNPRVKLVRQVQSQRHAREDERLFVAEGARLIGDLSAADMRARFALTTLAAQASLSHLQIEQHVIADALMNELSDETTPSGALAVFEMPTHTPSESWQHVLILDTMRNPGNLGACLRVAAGAGCDAVLLSRGCVDPFNPKVVRGGMGAHARLPILQMEWSQIAAVCQGKSVFAADAHGALRYDQADWRAPSALIIGGEASGISADAHALVTHTLRIPLSNAVESLNAAVACGIILFEAKRQREIGSAGSLIL